MSFICSNTFGLQRYSVKLMRGSHGSKIAEFNPHSIVVDPAGDVYVTDEKNDRVQEFDSNGKFIRKWGSKGSADGQLLSPEGIDLDSSGNVYVADTGNSRIQKFTRNGTFVTKWGSEGHGKVNHPERKIYLLTRLAMFM